MHHSKDAPVRTLGVPLWKGPIFRILVIFLFVSNKKGGALVFGRLLRQAGGALVKGPALIEGVPLY